MLSIENLSVTYGAAHALEDVSLTVPDGAIISIVGSNGAGKTTLLRAISGNLLRHNGSIQAGQVLFNGRPLPRDKPHDAVSLGIVQVPEGRRIFGRLSVEENLKVGFMGGDRRRYQDGHWEQVVGLFPVIKDRLAQRAGLMSGGEQQMLAIARALMASPRLLLLDEPSLGLAPKMVHQVGEMIHRINSEGVSVLLVEQNAALALDIATHAFVLETGRVSLSGDTETLRSNDEVQNLILGSGGGKAAIPHGDAEVGAP